MANMFVIRDLCNTRKITLKQLCENINISEAGMQRILKLNKTTTDTLELIAHELDVPISVFFDETAFKNLSVKEEEYNKCLNENYILNSLVQELRFRLNSGELYIESLINNIKFITNKHPGNEVVKLFTSLTTSNDNNPFSNVDIKKIIDEARSKIVTLSSGASGENNNYVAILFDQKQLGFEEIKNRIKALLEKYPDLKNYEEEITHFIFYEIIDFEMVEHNKLS